MSSTALGLSLTAAAAQNITETLQTGDWNSAGVWQTGDGNTAGNLSMPLTQSGDSNDLFVTQSGDDNTLGLGSNATVAADGVQQISSSSLGSAMRQNDATVLQSSDDNNIDSIVQHAESSAGAISTQNTLDITQGGGGNHELTSVYQYKSSAGRNDATVMMTGTTNTINEIWQDTDSGTGTVNTLDINISGSNNNDHSIWYGGVGADSVGSVQPGVFIQAVGGSGLTTGDNSATIDVSGNGNEFGTIQRGMRNTVGTLQITGNFNDLATRQRGNDNTIVVASIDGWFNGLGIRQIGNNNLADAQIIGGASDDNRAFIHQTQDNNEAYLTIEGDNNGAAFGFTSGSMAEMAAAPPGTVQMAGVIRQNATLPGGNVADLDVDGNNNAFRVHQIGSNTFDGMIDGNGNQMSVYQNGANNSSGNTQIGNGNNVGIYQ
ncbi:hypothetical protein [Profundibacterium mesophilum]|nr:hypothetical protein [Profundibacterium mesophilum]